MKKKNEGLNTPQQEIDVVGKSRFNKSVENDIVKLDGNEIRYLVDYYYQKQEERKTKFSQIRAVKDKSDIGGEYKNTALQWLAENSKTEEEQLKKMLDLWSKNTPVGRWMQSIVGIGPVITAGFLCYLDISKAQHAARFYSYVGLNDNNIPWLGKTKSVEVTNKVMKQYHEEMDNILDLFVGDIDNEKKFKKMMVSLSKAYPYRDELYTNVIYPVLSGDEESIVTDNTAQTKAVQLLLDCGEIDTISRTFNNDSAASPSLFADLCHYVNNKDIMTATAIDIASKETNRLASTIENGLQTCINVTKSKKDKRVAYTKAELISYLAKPPYNTKLKTLCWKVGDSFLKRSNHPDSLYGRLYKERKAYETRNNNNGCYAKEAQKKLTEMNIKNEDVRKVYESGRLTDAHINNRALRWTVKIFITHLFEIMYMDYYHKAPPKIYALLDDKSKRISPEQTTLGHADYIAPEIPYEVFIDVPDEYYQNYPDAKIKAEQWKKDHPDFFTK